MRKIIQQDTQKEIEDENRETGNDDGIRGGLSHANGAVRGLQALMA